MRIKYTCKDGSRTLALWPSMALLHWIGLSFPSHREPRAAQVLRRRVVHAQRRRRDVPDDGVRGKRPALEQNTPIRHRAAEPLSVDDAFWQCFLEFTHPLIRYHTFTEVKKGEAFEFGDFFHLRIGYVPAKKP
jgi:hypothetical protein